MFSVARGCEGSSGRLQTSPHRECWRCRRRDQQQQQQPQPRQPPQLPEPQETLRAGRRGPKNCKRRARTAAALSQPPIPGPGAPGPKLRPPLHIHTPTHIHTPPVPTSTLLLLPLSHWDWRQCIPATPKWGTLHRLTLRGKRTVHVCELIPWNQSFISFVLLYVYTCATVCKKFIYFYSARMH